MPRGYRVAASIHASLCASKPRRMGAKAELHCPASLRTELGGRRDASVR
jgi:hypothetical protein